MEVSPLKYFLVADGVSDLKFGCSVCGNLYKWRKSLNKHWTTCHNSHPGDDIPTPEGMRKCLDGSDYRQSGHRRCVKESVLQRLEVAPYATEEGVIRGLFRCTLCKFEAGRPFEVLFHYKKVHEDRPHACKSCLYKTKWRHDLRKHQLVCKGRRHSEDFKGSKDLMQSSIKSRPKRQNGLHQGEQPPPLQHAPAGAMAQHNTISHHQIGNPYFSHHQIDNPYFSQHQIDRSNPYFMYCAVQVMKQSLLRTAYNFTYSPFWIDQFSRQPALDLSASQAAPAPTGPVSAPGPGSPRRPSIFYRPWET